MRARRGQRAYERRRAPRQLDVRAPHLQHVRLARRDGRRSPTGSSGRGRRRRRARPAARRARTRRGTRGTSASFHGAARRFWAMPPPKAIPKCGNVAGETTSTSTPAARDAVDRVGDEAAGDVVRRRGYDVVRTTTFIRASREDDRDSQARAPGTRRSNRTASSGRTRSTRASRRARRCSPRRAGARAQRAGRAPRRARGPSARAASQPPEHPERGTPRTAPCRRGPSRRSARRSSECGPQFVLPVTNS